MDQSKIGTLIRKLRRDGKWTQRQLADQLGVSDKAVSKWERGMGFPDPSFLSVLAEALEIEPGILLSGDLKENDGLGGNMKHLKFYVCPGCNNMITATGEMSASCCGRKLKPMEPEKATDQEKLSVEIIENEYYVSAAHPMTREHHIAFVALLTGDTLMMRRQYPEWDLQVRIPRIGRGKLVWYCTQHGLFYQLV